MNVLSRAGADRHYIPDPHQSSYVDSDVEGFNYRTASDKEGSKNTESEVDHRESLARRATEANNIVFMP